MRNFPLLISLADFHATKTVPVGADFGFFAALIIPNFSERFEGKFHKLIFVAPFVGMEKYNPIPLPLPNDIKLFHLGRGHNK